MQPVGDLSVSTEVMTFSTREAEFEVFAGGSSAIRFRLGPNNPHCAFTHRLLSYQLSLADVAYDSNVKRPRARWE